MRRKRAASSAAKTALNKNEEAEAVKESETNDDVEMNEEDELFQESNSTDSGSNKDTDDEKNRSLQETTQEEYSNPPKSVTRPQHIDLDSLASFLEKIDQHSPIIPDFVLDYYLSTAGFNCPDRRIKRLLGLAAQKFLADIAQDAYQFSKIRHGPSGPSATRDGHAGKTKIDRSKSVLTLDDLSAALNDYGINIKRPEFYR